MIPAHPAFTFTPVQEDLLQAALRRDGQTARRWTARRRAAAAVLAAWPVRNAGRSITSDSVSAGSAPTVGASLALPADAEKFLVSQPHESAPALPVGLSPKAVTSTLRSAMRSISSSRICLAKSTSWIVLPVVKAWNTSLP